MAMVDPSALTADEFRRLVAIDQIGDVGLTRDLAASNSERAALAERFSLRAIASLHATVHLVKAGRDGSVRMRATFTADVVQTCVFTLEPVAASLQDSFEILFAPDNSVDGDVQVSPDDEVDPEPLPDEAIDVGEVIAQHLGLNLDPYPRCPDVVFSPEEISDESRNRAEEDAGSPARESPFAVLRNLKSTT